MDVYAIDAPEVRGIPATEADRRKLREVADTLEQLIATCNAGVERLRASRGDTGQAPTRTSSP